MLKFKTKEAEEKEKKREMVRVKTKEEEEKEIEMKKMKHKEKIDKEKVKIKEQIKPNDTIDQEKAKEKVVEKKIKGNKNQETVCENDKEVILERDAQEPLEITSDGKCKLKII